MSTVSENPASAAATNPSSPIETPHKIRTPTTLNTSTPITPQEMSQHTNSSMNNTDTPIRRAERFWVPLCLSEEEKRLSRAQRFGTFPGTGATILTEELKRKARAKRFGQAANSTVDHVAKNNSAIDDDSRKKARLARFGSIANKDTEEEEKKKARALRFSQSAAKSQTKSAFKITKKTAATGSKIGGT